MSYWYGLSFDDVASMPMASIAAYLDKLPVRMAEYKVMMADPIALPHMKKNDQQNMVNSWNRAMNVNRPAQVVSPARLKMIGIGVRFEADPPVSQ